MSNNLDIDQVAPAQNQKETTINDGNGQLDAAITDTLTVTVDNTNALTLTDDQIRRFQFITVNPDGGSPPTATITLTVPAIKRGTFSVVNGTAETVTVTITGQSETPPDVLTGTTSLLSSDGSNVRGAGGGGASSFPLLGTDGAVGAPTYSFAAETTLGMFRDASGRLAFTDGTQRLQFETDGRLNVGGTANYETLLVSDDDVPNKKYVDDLVIAGVSFPILATDGLVGAPSYSFSGNTSLGIYRDASGRFSITDGTQRLRLESDGSLSVAGTLNYETLVTDDDDIPNKKYVDDAAGGGGGGNAQPNLFDNAVMQLWQENTTLAVAAGANVGYIADRWRYEHGDGGSTLAVTYSQNTDVPTFAQAGQLIPYSVDLQVTATDAAVGANEFATFGQRVEGFNLAQVIGQSVTYSFWVKTNLTGTYTLALRNSGTDRYYISEFAVGAANTWEKKSVTVNMNDTTGTWDYLNGIGLEVTISLRGGSSLSSATLNTWTTGNILASNSNVNWGTSLSDYFRFTGGVMQIGTSVASIPVRHFEVEVARCQRYYSKTYELNTVPGTVTSTSGIIYAQVVNSTAVPFKWRFPVQMRIVPNLTSYSTVTGASGVVYNSTAAADQVVAAFSAPGDSAAPRLNTVLSQSAGNFLFFQLVADARL